jgi:hypothetical protein
VGVAKTGQAGEGRCQHRAAGVEQADYLRQKRSRRRALRIPKGADPFMFSRDGAFLCLSWTTGASTSTFRFTAGK